MKILDAKLELGAYIAIVIIGIFVLCLLVVGILKLIQISKKQSKRTKNAKLNTSDRTIEIFGGEDNIEHIEVQLNRVTIKVVNKTKVAFDVLKSLGIGCQITGNIIKVSSKEVVDSLKDYKK